MKRIITFMMALALVLSLGIAAFAGETNGSITITNTTVDETYSIYKIFDATYNADGDVSYSIKTDNQFFDDLFGDGTAVNDYFNYDAATGVVTKKDGIDNSKMFKYLAAMVKTGTATASEKATAETLDFTGLATGYYVIVRENAQATAVTITTTKPHADVYDKNQLPGGDFEKEILNDGAWAEDNSANIGDTVYFKLSFTATNYDGAEKVTYYTITDTLNPAEWADINLDSIQIKILNGEGEADDIVLTKGTDWAFEGTPTKDAFTIKIDWVNSAGEFKYDATEVIEVTYNAVVTAGAASNDGAQENKNEAELDWDSNTENPEEDDTKTYVFNLGFAKVDGKTDIKLAGAEFALTDANGNPVNVSGANGVYTVDKDATSNLVVTMDDGQIIVKGLAEGTYYLEETKAPDGYNKLNGKIEVVVDADQTPSDYTIDEVTYTANNAELNIENNSGVELPSTGGKGTMMLITFGSVVAMAFAMLLITQKKMSIYRD